ncbi:NAD(P)-binding protein [Vibrio parahaemolyticus]
MHLQQNFPLHSSPPPPIRRHTPRQSAAMAPRKRVLVVGGGFAGCTAARQLKSFDVTLIDPKP